MFDLLSRQAILSGIVILFGLPFAIFYITSYVFHRRLRSNVLGKSPPVAPYYVPGVFHAFGLATTGPQTYLARLLKEYKGIAPFLVYAGPQPFLVVHDSKQIEKIVKASQSKHQNAANIEVFDKIYASPQITLDLYAGKASSEADKSMLEHVRFGLVEKHFTGAQLTANIENYIAVLSTDLNGKMFQIGSWTQIEDSWSFLQQVFTRCILTSLFGSDLFKQYPGIIKDYWEFAYATEGFIPGLPRYWVPGAAVQIRERLHRGIEKWLKANHSGSEFARTADGDPIWDELKGSKFVQERDAELAKLEGMGMQARVAEVQSIIHASTLSLVPCIIWSILEISHRPKVAKQLTADVSRYSPSRGATYNVREIINLRLMRSIQDETHRLRTATLFAHIETQDLVLDKTWTAPGGVPILAFTQSVALNTGTWREAQPHVLKRPLHEFWPERFLMRERVNVKSSSGVVASEASSNVGSIEPMDIKLLDGCQRVLGKAYANAMYAATLAVLSNDFELQICDAELFEQSLPPPGTMAFGILKPLGEVALRIRKRNL
ncbi:cytochrome P450 [Phaeosphaeria sp. MPI-PUGE-AT-0046c]|nr:cytochrome P450 [Phaeosphaeria sp. MPI-PUGE-AT-0046c]